MTRAVCGSFAGLSRARPPVGLVVACDGMLIVALVVFT